MAAHKIEEITSIGTSGGVVIGCTCGWVHTERSVYKAREKARAAYTAHKAGATVDPLSTASLLAHAKESASKVRLTRTPEGYVSSDGRFTVTPVTMGEGVNSNRGWSKGHREWKVESTDGTVLGPYGRNSVIVHALYAARDLIEGLDSRVRGA